MKHSLWLLFLLPLFSYATTCPKWTEAQEEVLRAAKAYGEPYDLGWTLAAITAQEGFVGPYIIRHNVEDSGGGSFGITHIQLKTAMYLLNIKNVWEAKAVIPKKLLLSDEFSFKLSIMKLKQSAHLPWRQMVAKYNGTGQAAQLYAEKVANNVKMLQRCYKGE